MSTRVRVPSWQTSRVGFCSVVALDSLLLLADRARREALRISNVDRRSSRVDPLPPRIAPEPRNRAALTSAPIHVPDPSDCCDDSRRHCFTRTRRVAEVPSIGTPRVIARNRKNHESVAGSSSDDRTRSSSVQELLIRAATEFPMMSLVRLLGFTTLDLWLCNRPLPRDRDQSRGDVRRGEGLHVRASHAPPQPHVDGVAECARLVGRQSILISRRGNPRVP